MIRTWGWRCRSPSWCWRVRAVLPCRYRRRTDNSASGSRSVSKGSPCHFALSPTHFGWKLFHQNLLILCRHSFLFFPHCRAFSASLLCLSVHLDHDGVGVEESGVEISDSRDHRLDRGLAPEHQFSSNFKNISSPLISKHQFSSPHLQVISKPIFHQLPVSLSPFPICIFPLD